tara:strand:- start:425 stop:652 length:228 start_codon:yes stop_codon:yes gene_type:complete
MNEEIKKFTYRFDSFFNGMLITALLVCVFAWACDEYYFGKSEEEISEDIMRSAFQADSLLGEIKMLLGDSSLVNK